MYLNEFICTFDEWFLIMREERTFESHFKVLRTGKAHSQLQRVQSFPVTLFLTLFVSSFSSNS